ncbi:sulfite exporter TauE/SafE family protein [Aquabacterium sp.]|uniref:sulfite exporter TauE/SafE family protein n=1 Tax=Aquabacterium sp. TaxID=1872578 RepID=UPI002BB65451|nr:sulfite exporter TauE/SafE family protein [Aquabacterium sp.]HSW05128.1 sulfite exporter TauE/SafE family protein [Aquabacterium sp.]
MPAIDSALLHATVFVPWAVCASFVLAGLVKGVVGLGLPTVAMGLLGTLMPPAEAAALLLLPSLATNLWQMLRGAGLAALLRRLWPMQIGVIAGTLLSPVGLAGLDAGLASAGLGVALLLYAAVGLGTVRLVLPASAQCWAGALVGGATGAVTAATGVFVMPAVPYLQGLSLGKDALVQALGLSFTVSTVALAARLALDGALVMPASQIGAALLLPLAAALLGMGIGQTLRGLLSDLVFRRLFFAGLLMLGLQLLLRR